MSVAWEAGSDFHWIDPPGEPSEAWPGIAFGNGRQALLAALDALAPKRVWVPDYYCLDVTHAAIAAGWEVKSYPHCPGRAPGVFDVQPADCVVAVDFFGWGAPEIDVPERATVLVDRTHGLFVRDDRPWFASLRKTLPVPDGGWLHLHREVERPTHRAQHHQAAAQRLSAMLLKREFLAGRFHDKASFRAEAVRGEQAFAALPSTPLAVSREVATGYDWSEWEGQRRRNWQAFGEAFEGIEGAVELCGGPGSTFIVLRCASGEARASLRSKMISGSVYPAVLWDLDGSRVDVSTASRVFAESMLALHCDGRYGSDDMRRIAELCSASD